MHKHICIETPSLRIRAFRPSDLDALYALTCQPEITDLLPDWRMTREELEGFLAFVIGSYDTYDPDDVRILLVLEHASDGRLIGWCGVFPNDLLPPEQREVAYAISRDDRNRGYTTEAVRAVMSYVFQSSSLERIVAIVKPFNIASRRVVEKAGLRHVQTLTLSDGVAYDYFVVEKQAAMEQA